MLKKCKNEIVTINYDGLGNVEYSCISAIMYNPDEDIAIFKWADGDCTICENASDVYGFITFEDGTEWKL